LMTALEIMSVESTCSRRARRKTLRKSEDSSLLVFSVSWGALCGQNLCPKVSRFVSGQFVAVGRV
jgi:hypothetical protein